METSDLIQESPFVEYLGIDVTRAEDGYGEATLELEDHHSGPPGGNIAHGGVIAAFADTLGGTVAFSLAGQAAPTIDMRTDYLHPANCERLHGIAEVRQDGGSTVTIDIEITDETGRDIAKSRGVFKTDNPKDDSKWETGWQQVDRGEE